MLSSTKYHDRGRGRIGVLVPFTNVNLEPDMMLLRPPGISVHFARMGGYDVGAIPDADQMAGLGAAPLDEPLTLLAGVKPDVILYGCTSATLTHGTAFDHSLAQQIKALTGAPTVTAAGALITALNTLNVKQIGFASPYTADINQAAINFLTDSDFTIVSSAEVTSTLDNYGQGELTPEEVFALAQRADSPAAQAIVLSCTEMRSVETILSLEQALGKPVITSNQAMMFAAMQHLNIDTYNHPFGVLFQSTVRYVHYIHNSVENAL